MERVNTSDIKKIVCDRLELETSNVSLNARMGKNMIKIQNFFFKNILNGDPLYCLVPKESTRISDGVWEYDMSSFKIYKISREALEDSNFDKDLIGVDSKTTTSIYLTNDLLVYDSDKGVKEIDNGTSERKLTTREYACLLLELPDSGTKWLDDLIIKKNKNKLLNLKVE
jgi:hypothetical protein